jgi:glucokinase
VVIGGGFSAASDLLLPAARAALAQDGLTPGRDTVRIVLAQLGTDAGLVGAALVAREALAAASAQPV